MCPAAAPVVRASSEDRCPGALSVHQAADGGLARVRVPGGQLSATAWTALISASAEFGDGRLQLTSRGNVEIRGLAAGTTPAFSARLSRAGLLPSLSHERVRNIVCSPLSGLDGVGRSDLSSVVAAVDEALQADPELAQLSGRFLFGLDDGRGDILGLSPDLVLQAAHSVQGSVARLYIAGCRSSITTTWPAAPAILLHAARAFLAERALCPSPAVQSGSPAVQSGSPAVQSGSPAVQSGSPAVQGGSPAVQGGSPAWRIREVPDGAARIASSLGGSVTAADVAPRGAANRGPAFGVVHGPGSQTSIVVGVPLGELDPAQAACLTSTSLRITPWRSIVVPKVDSERLPELLNELQAVGLSVSPDSPWQSVSACTGRPGCSKALADVRTDARAARADLSTSRPVHWSGCERRCGHPAGAFLDVLATARGYRVSEVSA